LREVDRNTVPEVSGLALLCLGSRRSSPTMIAGDERRVITGRADHVEGNLWLEVYLPTQGLNDKTATQVQPSWFYSPVISTGGNRWTARATIGVANDSTPKVYIVRLLECGDSATEDILNRSYILPDAAAKNAGVASNFRYSYPWGHSCGQPLDEMAVHVAA